MFVIGNGHVRIKQNSLFVRQAHVFERLYDSSLRKKEKPFAHSQRL